MNAKHQTLRKLSVSLAILILAVGGGIYLTFWPTYKHTIYKVPGCSNTYLTRIEYTKFMYREFAFAYGIRREREIPDKECVISSKMSGIDAILQLYVTCENKRIHVYPAYGELKSVSSSDEKLVLKLLYREQLDSFRANKEVLYIQVE